MRARTRARESSLRQVELGDDRLRARVVALLDRLRNDLRATEDRHHSAGTSTSKASDRGIQQTSGPSIRCTPLASRSALEK